MDETTIIFCLGFAAFCFTFVFWFKKSENKFKYQKTKMADLFIKKRGIHVSKLYVGTYFDLVHDAKNEQIWFFVLRHNNTLQYKNIPYNELFQVDYKLDGHTVKSASRSGKLKKELIGGKRPDDSSPPPATWKKSNDFRAVKEIRLTVHVDDMQTTTLDFVFHHSHLPVDAKHMKDKDAQEWYNIFTSIIETEERKRA